jgi:hypothetical protein
MALREIFNRILVIVLTIDLVSLQAFSQTAENTSEPSPKQIGDSLIAGAKFGVTFYKGLDAAYMAGKAERAYESAQKSNLLESDLSSISDAYIAKRNDARATANFSYSAGGLGVAVAGIGLASGVGTVPTLLIVAGVDYANKQVSQGLREAGEARAMVFLNQAMDSWQTKNGLTYDKVRAELRDMNTDRAAEDFDKATGMLSDLRNQLQDDPKAAQAAQNFLLETMRTTEKATISQTAQNTRVIGSVQQDLANQVRFSRTMADKTMKALDEYSKRLDETNTAVAEASKQIQALEHSQAITGHQVSVIEDVLYQQQSAGTKVYMLQNNYKPELTQEQRQQLVTYFQAQEQKEHLIAESAKVVDTAREVQGILANLGFHDPLINKAVEFSGVAQKALSSALTGNYLGAILSVTSLFGSRSDPEAERFAQIMGYLQQMNQTLNRVLDLQVKTLQAIETLSKQVADMDRRLNLRLDHLDFEVKVISANLRSLMWSSYLECNRAWEDRTLDGRVQFDNESFNFASTRDAYLYATEQEGKAVNCAGALDNAFLSIKETQVFGQLLSLRTAAQSDFHVLPNEEGAVFTQDDLKKFLEELYQPTIAVVDSSWDQDWGAKSTLLAMLGDPAPNLSSLEQKLEVLATAKSTAKPFHACSAPTILSLRLRSLLCVDKRYADAIIPAAMSNKEEIQAAKRTAAFFGEPMIRDQLPWLAQWTGLVARPYDFWTGTGNTYYSPSDLLRDKGSPKGRDVIWSLLSLLDVAIAQQAVLHGDVTTKVIYDLAWDKVGNHPIGLEKGLPKEQTAAVKLLMNENNPWLGKNVLLMALHDSLLLRDGTDVSPSVPYEKAMAILDSVMAESEGTSDEAKKAIQTDNYKKIQEAEFFLRGMFKLAADAHLKIEDKDDGFGGRVRKVLFVFGSFRLEMPSASDFATLRLSYPPSLVSLVQVRDVMVDRFVDYDLLNGLPADQKQRVAVVLFSGLSQAKQSLSDH